MSTMACEIVGTGDGKVANSSKNDELPVSNEIAKDLILEIVESALDVAVDPTDVVEKCNLEAPKEKPNPLIGTGDQGSNECFQMQEAIPYHPPVEKKNRLTDLVKNSKQILAKIMLTDSKMTLADEKNQEEKILEVIDLECVQPSDMPSLSRKKPLPETARLPPDNESEPILPQASTSTAPMDDVHLTPSEEEGVKPTVGVVETRRMTFPRMTGSRARAAFAAKCRTLKKEASNLKKKKWDVSGRLANLFRKKKEGKEGKSSGEQSDKL